MKNATNSAADLATLTARYAAAEAALELAEQSGIDTTAARLAKLDAYHAFKGAWHASRGEEMPRSAERLYQELRSAY